jgi:hypothetical protein
LHLHEAMDSPLILSLIMSACPTKERARLSLVQKSWNEFNKDSFHTRKMVFLLHRQDEYIDWIRSRSTDHIESMTFFCNFIRSASGELHGAIDSFRKAGLGTSRVKRLSIHQCHGVDYIDLAALGARFPNLEELKIFQSRYLLNVHAFMSKSRVKTIQILGSLSRGGRHECNYPKDTNALGETVSIITDYDAPYYTNVINNISLNDKWVFF